MYGHASAVGHLDMLKLKICSLLMMMISEYVGEEEVFDQTPASEYEIRQTPAAEREFCQSSRCDVTQ